ncbi:hypothetical protein ACJX0J_031131 [Zea mays]
MHSIFCAWIRLYCCFLQSLAAVEACFLFGQIDITLIFRRVVDVNTNKDPNVPRVASYAHFLKYLFGQIDIACYLVYLGMKKYLFGIAVDLFICIKTKEIALDCLLVHVEGTPITSKEKQESGTIKIQA